MRSRAVPSPPPPPRSADDYTTVIPFQTVMPRTAKRSLSWSAIGVRCSMT